MSDQLNVEILSDGSVQSKVPARIGLLGNPSDGYGGRVLAFSVSNFHAIVKLQPSTKLQFLPNPESDSDSFLDIQSFQKHIKGSSRLPYKYQPIFDKRRSFIEVLRSIL